MESQRVHTAWAVGLNRRRVITQQSLEREVSGLGAAAVLLLVQGGVELAHREACLLEEGARARAVVVDVVCDPAQRRARRSASSKRSQTQREEHQACQQKAAAMTGLETGQRCPPCCTHRRCAGRPAPTACAAAARTPSRSRSHNSASWASRPGRWGSCRSRTADRTAPWTRGPCRSRSERRWFRGEGLTSAQE